MIIASNWIASDTNDVLLKFIMVVLRFLNSDMTKLPDEKRLAFNQCKYSDELLKSMIEKIVYNNHKISTFIKIKNIEYLQNFQKQDYMNPTCEPMDYYVIRWAVCGN